MAGRGTTATAALERARIPFTVHEYARDPRHESYGQEAVEALGVPAGRVFKTLIAEVDGKLVAGVVPVDGQLDLKALAGAAGGKRAAMADPPRPNGPPATSRAASPRSASASACRWWSSRRRWHHRTVFCSGGRRGLEIELAPADLVRAARATVASIGTRT